MAAETFKDLGLVFDSKGNCAGCLTENCSNNVESKKDGKEYCVHISTNKKKTIFRIHANETANTSGGTDLVEDFTTEKRAVKFVCDNFHGFKCA